MRGVTARRLLSPALLTGAIGLLLAIVALGSAGARSWSGEENEPRGVPQWLVDYGYTTLIVLGLLSAPLVLWLVGYGRAKGRVTDRWQLRSLVTLCLFCGAFALVYATFAQLPAPPSDETACAESQRRQSPAFAPTGGGEQGNCLEASARPIPLGAERKQREPAEFQWWLAGAIVVGAVGGFVYLRRRRARREHVRPASGEEELSAVLDDTLDDLRSESDARRAVIAAYARMERTLAAHGLPRKTFEAPLEYLSRVLQQLRVRAASAFALTELFERAKFSPHEIDAGMKDEAIAALVSVRDDLRATT
jgi:uncharacterized membrane protein